MTSGREDDNHVGSDASIQPKHHEKLQPLPEHDIYSVRLAAYELANLSVVPATLAALVRLNIFETLAMAHCSQRMQELARLAMPGKPINVAYLGRMLRMMSSQKILSEVVRGIR